MRGPSGHPPTNCMTNAGLVLSRNNDSLRLMFALATHVGLDTDQLHIQAAFLNRDLVAEICIIPSPGIGVDVKILPLDEALYSLKHASLGWFENLCDPLANIGFISLPFHACVFISADQNTIVVVYVDDITMAESWSYMNWLIDDLCSQFKFTVNGRHNYSIGIEIKHTPEGMELSQPQYINNILSPLGMDAWRPVSTTIYIKTCLVKVSDSNPVFEQNLYQRMIGSLMYLVTCTRPDLALSVSHLSRFSAHPLAHYHTAVERVFHYRAGTGSISLNYQRSPTSVPLSIVAFSDSDYTSCCDTRRSVSGYAFMWNARPISSLSTKQQSIAHSTTEAEYVALATTSR